jgi:hypothetical protein
MPINTGRFSRNRRQILNGGLAPEPLLNAERTDQILFRRHRIPHLVAQHVPFTVALAIRTLPGVEAALVAAAMAFLGLGTIAV